jgi:hypothetical protein
MKCKTRYAWKRQIATLEIAEADAVTDDGRLTTCSKPAASTAFPEHREHDGGQLTTFFKRFVASRNPIKRLTATMSHGENPERLLQG